METNQFIPQVDRCEIPTKNRMKQKSPEIKIKPITNRR